MIIIRSRYIPFGHFAAINLLGVLFVDLLNHERIHTRQMLEMAILPFYIAYVLEWLVRLPMRGNAYRNISFEREAFHHECDPDYLSHRRPYAWLREMRKENREPRTENQEPSSRPPGLPKPLLKEGLTKREDVRF